MNRLDGLKLIEEMVAPSSKILYWTNTVKQEFYPQYRTANPELFDEMLQSALKLANSLQELQNPSSKIDTHVFTHELSGLIMRIRDNMAIILSKHKQLEKIEISEKEKEFFRYLKKIYSAAEYLSSLDRDAVLKMMLERMDKEGKLHLKPDE